MVQIRLLRNKRIGDFFSHPEVKACLLIVAAISLLIALDSTLNGMFNGFWEASRASLFQTVSILTTTGYTVVDIADYPPLSTWLVMLLMAIGGGLCSTGGAVKIMRVVVIVKLVYYIILKNVLPESAVKPFKVGRHVVGEEESLRILGFLAAYSFLLIIESILLTVLGGFDPLTSISGALSAQGNVGPSLLPVSSRLPETVKAILIFGMWAGRLEIFPVLVFLAPTTWRSLLGFRARHR
jgi:trk system potassium uptake protein TrkH